MKPTNYLLTDCDRIGQLIGGMIAKSEKFCSPHKTVKEALAEYLIEEDA